MLLTGILLGYVAALGLSGLLMIVLGGVGFGQSGGARTVEVLVGIGFLAYAGYLVFVFDGGRVAFVYWVLLAPVLSVVNIVRSRRAQRLQEEQLAATYAAEANPRVDGR
jgi:thiol:disulfide interchange protein